MNGAYQKISFIPHTEALPDSISRWSLPSRLAAKHIIARYGLPNRVTDTKLLWFYNSPWKRTVVLRDGARHEDPHKHIDVLAQTVEYRVLAKHITALKRFNSSLVIDVARKELTAQCDSEATNCMVLNLAHDIIIGERTVEEAREALHNMAGALRLNWPEQYAQTLQFDWHDVFTETQQKR